MATMTGYQDRVLPNRRRPP